MGVLRGYEHFSTAGSETLSDGRPLPMAPAGRDDPSGHMNRTAVHSREHVVPSRRLWQRWFRAPATVLALGVLSIVLLVWINRIDGERQDHFARLKAIMDMELRMAVSHHWLEESIAGEASIDMKRVWGDMDRAVMLSQALLKGGRLEDGMAFEPVVQPTLRGQMQEIKVLLDELREMAINLDRLREPDRFEIGAPRVQRFNALFKEVINRAAILQSAVETDLVGHRVQSTQLFITVLVIWIVIVIFTAVGFSKRERQKKTAEEALREAHDELEHRVEDRTRELITANEQLQGEVAERRRAEESLKLFEEVVNNMPIGLYVFHLDDHQDPSTFRLIATNPVASLHTGMAAEKMLGKTMPENFPWLLKTVVPTVCAEVVRSGRTEDLGELSYGDRDGDHVSFSVQAFPLPKDCVGVIFENITERKRAEEALRESESKFRRLSLEFHSLLDAIPDQITLLSPDMRVRWANKGATDAAGVDVAALTGKICYEVWHGRTTPCDHCAARKCFASGKPESTEVATANEAFWKVRAYPILDEVGNVINVIAMTTDITERVAYQTQAMRTAHLASLGKLAAGVAHEVNNPTNCVINYAQILSNKIEPGTEHHDIANRIVKEGMRISNIVKGLLSFARERKGEKIPVRIDEVLNDSLALSESLIHKQGIRVSVDLPADLPEVVVNPQQIEQVFLNVISNARYALNEKYPGFHEDKVLHICGKHATIEGRPGLSVTFRDHGCGIPDEIMDKIMLPFFSTKPTGKGTGLGLSISHGIVNDHGGMLMVRSSRGEWTEVVVALPAKA